jgi:hypothetical protein
MDSRPIPKRGDLTLSSLKKWDFRVLSHYQDFVQWAKNNNITVGPAAVPEREAWSLRSGYHQHQSPAIRSAL